MSSLRSTIGPAESEPEPAGNDANDLPDWLGRLGEPDPTPAAQSPFPPLSHAPANDASDLPDWLGRSNEPDHGPAAQPSFSPPPQESAPADDASDLPDWLKSLSDLAGTPSEPLNTPAPDPTPGTPTAGRPSAGGFTGWLTGNTEPTPAPATPPPVQPPPPIQTRPAQPPQPAEPADDLPAWLRQASPASTPEQTDTGEDEPLPDWLRNLEPADASHADATQMAPPSWMNDRPATPAAPQTPPPAPPAPPPSEPASVDDDDSVPSWLRTISTNDLSLIEGDTDDLGATPFSFEGDPGPSTHPPAQQASPDIPAWLSDEPSEAPRTTGEATEWLGASASQLIRAEPPAQPPDDVPSWLQASEDISEDVPAWLRGPESPTTSENDPTLPEHREAESDLGWLTGSTPADQAEQPSQSAGGMRAEPDKPGDIPSWLMDSEPEAFAPGSSQSSLPDWLSTPSEPLPAASPPGASVQPPPAQPPSGLLPTTPSVTPSAPDELPAWLRNTAEEPIPAAAPQVDDSALPPWLRDESGEPLPTAVAPGDANLPAWLRGSNLNTPAASAPPAMPPAEAGSTQALGTGWFDDIDSSKTPSQSTATEGGMLGGADLPAWLRRETEKPRDTNAADARSLDWLSQLGIDDEQPGIADVPISHQKLTLPPLPVRTQAQLDALALLKRVAADPLPAVVPLSAPASRGVLQRFGLDRLVSLLLLVAVVAALTVPSLADMLPAMPGSPEAAALLEQTSALTENDTVLIGYEWDAQRISEFRPLEQAVLDDLIARKVKVVLVSTDPQGTLLQFDLLDRLEAEGYQTGATDYILLGYRPGGEIALRRLAQNLRGELQSDFKARDALNGPLATTIAGQPRLSTLDDFSMLLVFADEPSDVQSWMEQIDPATQRPIAFFIPEGVQPISQPYFAQPGIFYLAGIQDAQSYVQLLGNTAAPAGGGPSITTQAAQLRLVMLLFSGLLGIGIIGVLISRVASRRKVNA